MKGNAFIFSKDIVWDPIDDGVERQVLGYNDQLMMVCVRFKKGAVGATHHHSNLQVTYIVKGVFEVIIDKKKRILKNGDSFFVDSNVDHGVIAREDGCLIDIFTPAREDFF